MPNTCRMFPFLRRHVGGLLFFYFYFFFFIFFIFLVCHRIHTPNIIIIKIELTHTFTHSEEENKEWKKVFISTYRLVLCTVNQFHAHLLKQSRLGSNEREKCADEWRDGREARARKENRENNAQFILVN